MLSPTSSSETTPLLTQKAFSRFLFARMGSMIAYQMLGVAVGWQIYALTNSALFLGLVGLVQFLPMFLLTLAVGHVADRYDRRTIARICQIAQGGAAVVLAWGSFGNWLGSTGILALMFVIGAVHAFEGPSLHSLLPNLVPGPLIPRAAAWAASAFQTAVILGPALGGLLYAAGPAVVYSVAAVLFFGASVFLAAIRIEPRTPQKHEPVSLHALFAGIRFIRSRPDILGAISLDLFAVLLGGATALLPIYARDILIVGPMGLGLLRSAPAVGALVMSIVLARSPLQNNVGRTMFVAVAVFGVATIIFGLSTSFPLSLVALAILGAADVFSVVIRQSLVQIETPDAMRGRVSAVNSMFIGTSNQLGEFESGITAHWFGTVPAVLIGGIGTLVVVGFWIRLFPQLVRVERLEKRD
jgi:MFS family permease